MATRLGSVTLPDNPTPEQFERAEPLILKMILEDENTGYVDGIQPLTKVEADPGEGEFMRVAPGEYKGIFVDRDGSPAFQFEIKDGQSNYSPVANDSADS